MIAAMLWRPPKPFGPALWRELLALARTPRFFVARLTLVATALMVCGVVVAHQPDRFVGLGDRTALAEGFFVVLVWCQLVVLLLLTPSLVGGLVASERHNATLTLLLTTDLSAGEIVVGKLLSRLGALVAVSLATVPLVALVGLLGGIDYGRVALATAVTLTAVSALAAVGLWFSVRTRRTWVAVLQTYVAALLLWVGVPYLLLVLVFLSRGVGIGGLAAAGAAVATISPALPLGLLTDNPVTTLAGGFLGDRRTAALTSVAWNLLLTVAATAAAARALRRPLPVSRRQRRRRARLAAGPARGPDRRALGRFREFWLWLNPLLYRAIVVDVLDPEGRSARLQRLWGAFFVGVWLLFWWYGGHPAALPSFGTAAWLQAGMHLFAVVGGAAAVSRRGTHLDDLLLSSLSDRQIVVGALLTALLSVRPLAWLLTGFLAMLTLTGCCDAAFAASYLAVAAALLLFVTAGAVLLSVTHADTREAVGLALLAPLCWWVLPVADWLPRASMALVATAVVWPTMLGILFAPPHRRRGLASWAACAFAAVSLAALAAFAAGRIDENTVARLAAASHPRAVLLGNALVLAALGGVLAPSLLASRRHAGAAAALWLTLLAPLAVATLLHAAAATQAAAAADPQGAARWIGGDFALGNGGFYHWADGHVRELAADGDRTSMIPPLGWEPPGWRGLSAGASHRWGWLAAVVFAGAGLSLVALACAAFGGSTGRRITRIRKTQDGIARRAAEPQ